MAEPQNLDCSTDENARKPSLEPSTSSPRFEVREVGVNSGQSKDQDIVQGESTSTSNLTSTTGRGEVHRSAQRPELNASMPGSSTAETIQENTMMEKPTDQENSGENEKSAIAGTVGLENEHPTSPVTHGNAVGNEPSGVEQIQPSDHKAADVMVKTPDLKERNGSDGQQGEEPVLERKPASIGGESLTTTQNGIPIIEKARVKNGSRPLRVNGHVARRNSRQRFRTLVVSESDRKLLKNDPSCQYRYWPNGLADEMILTLRVEYTENAENLCLSGTGYRHFFPFGMPPYQQPAPEDRYVRPRPQERAWVDPPCTHPILPDDAPGPHNYCIHCRARI